MIENDRIFYAMFLLTLAFFAGYFSGMTLAELKGKWRIPSTLALYVLTIGLSVAAFVIRDEEPTSIGQFALYIIGTGALIAWCVKLVAYREEAWTTIRQLIGQFGYFAVGIPALMIAMSA